MHLIGHLYEDHHDARSLECKVRYKPLFTDDGGEQCAQDNLK